MRLENSPGTTERFSIGLLPGRHTPASASADETVKVWHVASQQRLDTMSQSEGEVHAVAFTPDGEEIVAVGADNRLRVWQLRSREKQRINPIQVTRYLDTEPLTDFVFVPETDQVVVLSQSGKLPVLRLSDWASVGRLPALMDTGSDLYAAADGKNVWVSQMDGNIIKRDLASLETSRNESISGAAAHVEPTYLEIESLVQLQETALRETHPNGERFGAAPRCNGLRRTPFLLGFRYLRMESSRR